jgi:peptidoglycan/xylan/chitin deacetylase (PgdA/CDA1 family)
MNLKKLFNVLVLVTVSIGLGAGCAPSLKSQLNDAVQENRTSDSFLSWQLSEKNPETLLPNLIQAGHNEQEICEELEYMAASDLTLLENSIQNFKSPCKNEILNKIDRFWQNEIFNLDQKYQKLNNFKFPDAEIYYRNIKNGYVTTSGELPPKRVLLTFDDGPHPQLTPQILNTLNVYNARGLFFLLGANAKRNPQIVQQLAESGHSIGSHSMTHKCLPQIEACRGVNKGKILTLQEAAWELKQAHFIIYEILGWIDPFIRLPYGRSSQPIRDYLRSHSTAEIVWNVDSEDWRSHMTPQLMIQHVMRQLNNVGSGILLFHDIQKRTAITLPYLLKELYFQGYQPVVIMSDDPKARQHSDLLNSQN